MMIRDFGPERYYYFEPENDGIGMRLIRRIILAVACLLLIVTLVAVL